MNRLFLERGVMQETPQKVQDIECNGGNGKICSV